MSYLSEGMQAPDFELVDTQDVLIRLSNYFGKSRIYLTFNRGFTCPFCQRHMTQLKRDYAGFVQRNVEVLVVGPDDLFSFKRYWQQENMPMVGLADVKSRIAALYNQDVNWVKLGRMPAQFVIGLSGKICYAHYGQSMRDITDNEAVLALIDALPDGG